MSSTEKPPQTPQDRASSLLNSIIADHTFWWWKALIHAKAWQYFYIWPIPELIRKGLSLFGKKQRPASQQANSSAWLTLGVVIFIASYQTTQHFKESSHLLQIAGDLSKILLTATFLVGTILSVSVAIPGQAVINNLLRNEPDFALEFVAPFMWSLMWGVLGAFGLAVMYYLTPTFQKIAFGVAIYAIVHTMRMYTIGLILHSVSEEPEEPEDALPLESTDPSLRVNSIGPGGS